MNKSTALTKAPGAARIKAAFKEAEHAASNAVQKAMICGQLLCEQRASMISSHGENSWHSRTKPQGDGFKNWLTQHVPEISQPTAYRWMELAERCVSAVELQISDVEVPLSHMLTLPEGELSKEALEARQLLFDFTSNKTMKECLAGIVVGGDPAHNLTRAANGKNARQTKGEERKDFALFTAVKLKDINAHLQGWERKTDSQRVELQNVIRAAIIGDTVKLAGRGGAFNFKPWPEDFARVALEALRERLKGTK